MVEIRQTSVFADWLDSLSDELARRKINDRIGRLEGGLLGDVRSVAGGVSELRVDSGPGYRLYFTRRRRIVFILLCAGDKDSQARDIRLAQALAANL